MGKRIYVTFDNFTVLDDKPSRWMEADQFEALPILDDQHHELWDNYVRAKAAHQAACYAIQHVLQFPEGSAEKEVERQKKVFERLWIMYCNMTNTFNRDRGTPEQAADVYQETIADMVKLLEIEKERS